MKDYSTIIQPVLTEKSSIQQTKGQYTFVVQKSATKIDIKNAIKTLYGAEVDKVTTSIVPKKTRLLKKGQVWAKRKSYKKAIISIKGGKTIDPNKFKDTK